jgi:hypothetical protein
MFFVLFTAVSVPYDTCFAPPHSDQRGRFDHAIDAVFAFDIALNFITGKVDKTGAPAAARVSTANAQRLTACTPLLVAAQASS